MSIKPRLFYFLAVSLIMMVGLFGLYQKLKDSGENVKKDVSKNLVVLNKNDLAEMINCKDDKIKKAKKAIEYRSAIPESFDFKSVNYTFMDPAKYSGPVVRGWPPGKSRDMSMYVKPESNTILTGKKSNMFL